MRMVFGQYIVDLECEVGDEVVVYYDGTIVEGEPTLVQKVYAITLRAPANRETDPEEEDKSAETLILKVNDTLYYGTDETGPMGDADAVDGYIEASVGVDEISKENGESNLGCVGNPYTRDSGDGWIMVFMDDEEYHIFYREFQEERNHRNLHE